MRSFFYLAGSLLGVSGVLHLVKLFVAPLDPAATIGTGLTALLGLTYLFLAFQILRKNDRLVPWAIGVPFLGVLFTLLGGNIMGSIFNFMFIILDILIILICGWLLMKGRTAIGRVQ